MPISEKPHHSYMGLLVLAAMLFVMYSFLPLTAPPKDNSPDENSNRFFSNLYADTGKLWVHEPLNFLAPGMIHPRSVRVDDQFLQPGGFLGLPVLYGSLGRVLGRGMMPHFTALFAVLGLVGFGLAVSRQFGRGIGLTAAVLLAVQPNWWYQVSRPYMPNGLLISLLLLAAGFLWGRPISWLMRRRRSGLVIRLIDPLMAGLMVGLALAVRPPVVYWLAIFSLSLVLATGWRQTWKDHWQKLLALAIGTIGSLTPFLVLQKAVYGSWLATGYGSGTTELGLVAGGGFGMKLIGPLQPYLFPLGFAPRSALQHWQMFGLGLYSWWWLMLIAAGLWWYLHRCRLRPKGDSGKRRLSRKASGLLVASLVTAAWLIVFYGSWTIRDNPDPNAVTIGSSYLRYWLPITVLSVLPLAWAIDHVRQLCAKRCPLVAGAIIGLVALFGAADVFMAPQEGLWRVQNNLFKFDYMTRRVIALTQPGDLVVVDRDDKFVFPARPVMYPLRSEHTWQAIGHLAPRLKQVYYLGITFPRSDMDWLRSSKLPPLDLQIEMVANFGEESLYVFTPDN